MRIKFSDLPGPHKFLNAAKRYVSRQQKKEPYLGPIITPDGYHLAGRFLPAQNLKYKEAVVMAHGVFCNSDVWRLGAGGRTFVERLRREGLDVVIVDNRGHGRSKSRSLTLSDDFDATVSDVPVVCKWALQIINQEEKFGFRKIHWVGHSMGAMMFMAYLSAHPEEARNFASFVNIAGPTRIQSNNFVVELVLESGSLYNFIFERMGLSRYNPMRIVMEGALPLAKKAPEGMFAAVFLAANWLELDNVSPDTTLQFLADAVEPLPIGIMNSLSQNIRSGRFASRDGKIDYLQGLEEISLDALFVSAGRDILVSREDMKEVYGLWGKGSPKLKKGENKQLVKLKQAGHIGVLFDEKAQETAIKFIKARSTLV